MPLWQASAVRPTTQNTCPDNIQQRLIFSMGVKFVKRLLRQKIATQPCGQNECTHAKDVCNTNARTRAPTHVNNYRAMSFDDFSTRLAGETSRTEKHQIALSKLATERTPITHETHIRDRHGPSGFRLATSASCRFPTHACTERQQMPGEIDQSLFRPATTVPR